VRIIFIRSKNEPKMMATMATGIIGKD